MTPLPLPPERIRQLALAGALNGRVGDHVLRITVRREIRDGVLSDYLTARVAWPDGRIEDLDL